MNINTRNKIVRDSWFTGEVEAGHLEEENCFQLHVFQDTIAVKYVEYTSDNEEASKQKCWALLRSLEEQLMAKYIDGKYAKNGGFAEFQEELNAISSKYELGIGLGVKVLVIIAFYLYNSKTKNTRDCQIYNSKIK